MFEKLPFLWDLGAQGSSLHKPLKEYLAIRIISLLFLLKKSKLGLEHKTVLINSSRTFQAAFFFKFPSPIFFFIFLSLVFWYLKTQQAMTLGMFFRITKNPHFVLKTVCCSTFENRKPLSFSLSSLPFADKNKTKK